MTLASGAHVSIGGIELMLARDDNGRLQYDETFESLFAPTQAIAGEIAASQIRPEKLLWSITDWSGGEGARIYHPQDPTTYNWGTNLNATVKGQLTTRPRRYRTVSGGGSATNDMRPVGLSANWHAVVAWEDLVMSSPDVRNWVFVQDTSPSMAGKQYADAITDGVNAAFLVTSGTGDSIPVVEADTSILTWADMNSGTNIDGPMVGCVVDGLPYVFGIRASDGELVIARSASQMDVAQAWASTVVYTTNIVPSGTWGLDYWTSAVSAESASYYSFATGAQSFIWEVRSDVGRPYWTAPRGFIAKKLVYHQGILFVLGNQMAAGMQFGSIWAIPVATRSPIHIAAPRKHLSTEMMDISVGCAGPGNTLLLADAASGKIFLYDIERDALHLFDDLTVTGTGDATTFNASSGRNLLTITQAEAEVEAQPGNNWPGNAGPPTTSRSTSAPFSGAAHWSMAGAGGSGVVNNMISSYFMPVTPSTAYTFRAWMRDSVTNTDYNARVKIVWYTSALGTISTSTGSDVASGGATYKLVSTSATSPSNAAYAKVLCEHTNAAGGNRTSYWDFMSLHPLDVTRQDKIAFLEMHGMRPFLATYTPLVGSASNSDYLQIIAYDDLEPDNRDSAAGISGQCTTGSWDFGLPMEQKALIGFYVTYKITDAATTSGLIANSRITIAYSTDDGTFTNAATITSATTPVGAKGRHFIQISSGSSTTKFMRLAVRITLDNNDTAGVAPPILYGVTVEAQPVAYARIWDLVVRVEDEAQNERPTSRAERASQIHADLVALATNKALVTFLDGAWNPNPAVYDTHAVMVEDPRSALSDSLANGVMRVRLRSVLS